MSLNLLPQLSNLLVPRNSRRINHDIYADLYIGTHEIDGETLLSCCIELGEGKDIKRVLKSANGNMGSFDPKNPGIFFQPDYNLKQQNDTARGATVFRPEDGQALIALFKGNRDISTIIYEGGGHTVGKATQMQRAAQERHKIFKGLR